MSISGHLTYASAFFGENHCGYLFNIATDLTHCVVQHDSGYVAKIGLAESPNTQGFTLTEAQFLIDAALEIPTLTGTTRWVATISAQGTANFVVQGTAGSLSGHSLQVFSLVYRIDDVNTAVVVYHQFMHTDGAGGGDLVPLDTVSMPRGAAVISNRLYWAANLSDNHFSPTSYSCLLDVSLVGTESSASAGSFANHSKLLGFSNTYFNSTADGRLLENRAAIFDAGGGDLGMIVCKDTGDAYGPVLFGLTISSGVASATTDLSSVFGWPFADTGKKYDGTASASARDRYTISHVLTTAGGWEAAFTRPYMDNRQYVGVRDFGFDTLWPVAATPNGGLVQYQHTSETVSAGSPESIQFYREGDDLLGGLRIDAYLYFGQVSLPPPGSGTGVRQTYNRIMGNVRSGATPPVGAGSSPGAGSGGGYFGTYFGTYFGDYYD